jgi:hypothetical protein
MLMLLLLLMLMMMMLPKLYRDKWQQQQPAAVEQGRTD